MDDRNHDIATQNLTKKRDRVQEEIQENPDCDYITKIIYNLFEMALEVDQVNNPSEITKCKRVVKLKRSVPLETIRLAHPELVIFEGVYLIVDGIALPESVMSRIGFYKTGRGRVIDTSDLPKGYKYGLLRDNGSYGFAFSNSDIVSGYINYSAAWELMDMNDYQNY
jgi:hypothetical protein